MRTAIAVALILNVVAGALITIGRIGKPRPAHTNGDGVIAVVIAIVHVAAILYLLGGCA